MIDILEKIKHKISVLSKKNLFFLIFLNFFFAATCLLGDERDKATDSVAEIFSPTRKNAQSAYELGFYSIADQIFKDCLKAETLNDSQKNDIYEKLATIAVARGNFEEADKFLKEISGQNDSIRLLRCIVAATRGQPNDGLINQIHPENLRREEKAWYYTLASDSAARHDLYGQSRDLWEQAKDQALDGSQLASIEELRLTLAVLLQPANDVLEEKLRTKLRSYNWRPEGLNSVKRYAIVLYRLGRTADALALLDKQLTNLPEGYDMARHELYLLEALLSKTMDEKNQNQLKAILAGNGREELQEAALRLLFSAAQTTTQQQQLVQFLDQINRHSSSEFFLTTRLQLALLLHDWNTAQGLTLNLLDRQTESRKIEALQALWVSLTLKTTQPDYGEIALMLENFGKKYGASSKNVILLSFATHFHEQQNFLLAEKFYEQILRESKNNMEGLRGAIRNAIDLGNDNRTLALFQEFLRQKKYQLEEGDCDLVKTVCSSLRTSETAQEAMGRNLDSLLASNPQRPSYLHQLLLYFLSENLYLRGEKIMAEKKLQEILDRYPPADLGELQAPIILLKARLLLDDGHENYGLTLLHRLRLDFPESEAMKESYFVLAEHFKKNDRLDEGRKELETFLQKVKLDDNQCSLVLLKLAELYGLPQDPQYEKALNILEQLINYGQNAPELLYQGRQKQAEILCKMNDFSSAAMIYESLLQNQPNHRESSRTEFYLAKCYLALANGRPSKWLTRAIYLLEKLHAQPITDVNFALEISFVFSFALERAAQKNMQQNVLWSSWVTFAKNPINCKRLNSDGMFWLQCIGQSLIKNLDPRIENDAIKNVKVILQQLQKSK